MVCHYRLSSSFDGSIRSPRVKLTFSIAPRFNNGSRIVTIMMDELALYLMYKLYVACG